MKKRFYCGFVSIIVSAVLLLSSCSFLFGETVSPSASSSDNVSSHISSVVGDASSVTADPSSDVSSLLSSEPQSKPDSSEASDITPSDVSSNASSRPSSDVSSKPSSDVSSRPSSDVSSRPSSDVSSKPSSDVSSKPSSDVSSKPSSDVSSRPSSDVSSRPSSDVSSKPSSDVSSRPSSDVSSKPSSDVSSKPSSDVSSRPSSDVSSKPSSDVSSGNTSSEDETQDVFTPITQSEYYYRSKLNSAEREMYDAIVSASDAYSSSISLPSPSSNDTVTKVLNFFFLDHPENFWWGRSYTLHTSGGRVVRLTMKMLYSESEIKQMQKEIDSAVDAIFKKIPKKASDFDVEKIFHDSLINGAEYVIPSNDPHGETMSYTLYGVLVEKKGVCESYSEAFQYLCNKAGIPCFGITGTASGGGHKWNGVKINGNWYLMDVTWDDPTGSTPVCRYYYFNVTEEMISDSHETDSELVSLLPAFTATKDSFYYHYGLVCDLESLDETFKNALAYFEDYVTQDRFSIELMAKDEDTAQDCYSALVKNNFSRLNGIVKEYNTENGTSYRFAAYYTPDGCYLKFAFQI